MIVVTGATGQLGSAVVEQLLARVPADQIGVSVRDPEKATSLADVGVRVRRGDFAEPASLAEAFEGADQVLLVSASTTGDEAIQLHGSAIEAARTAGVGRILYTSHMASSPGSAFAPMPDHFATEKLLEASGVPFTSLRNGFYAASGLMFLGQALHTGELAAPEDGPISWTAHADLAEAAATVLVEGGFEGATPPLTGSVAIDLSEVAAIASSVTGRAITRTVISDDEHVANLVGHGVPSSAAEMLVGMFVASRNGEFAAVDPTLEKLLGREPVGFGAVLAGSL